MVERLHVMDYLPRREGSQLQGNPSNIMIYESKVRYPSTQRGVPVKARGCTVLSRVQRTNHLATTPSLGYYIIKQSFKG